MKKSITADCLYVAGDSWTHGSELMNPNGNLDDVFAPVHETHRRTHYWPRLVANHLGLELIDGSYPGAGNDRMLRTCIYDVSQLLDQGRRPFVIVSWTQLHRFELPEPPEGLFYYSFVSPRDGNLPNVAKDIFKAWSFDRTDVTRWLQQILCMDYFIKANSLGYITTTVFRDIYRLFEEHTTDAYFKPYVNQIKRHVNFNRHFLQISMQTYLAQQENVTYGPGGHPLEHGHQLLAEQFISQINNKFQFQRHSDQSSAT